MGTYVHIFATCEVTGMNHVTRDTVYIMCKLHVVAIHY